MFERIRCYFSGHLPRRNKVKNGPFRTWTVCGRCNQLMARGYHGWQPANGAEERQFKRVLLKRAAEEMSYDEKMSGMTPDTDRVKLPWLDDEGASDT